MNLKDYIEKTKPLIATQIDAFFSSKKDINDLPFLKDAETRLLSFSKQGKMMRGILLIFSFEALKGKLSKETVNAAVAVELAHSALLIHDDIIDNDELRRGGKTVFAQYKDNGRNSGFKNSLFYGQSMGICVGDIALFSAFELLTQASHDSKIQKKLIQTFSYELQKVGAAEMQDVHFGYSDKEPSRSEISNVYLYKTARYSFSLPLVMGAILANANEKTIDQLWKLGENLGIVFQIKDDELGLFGESNITGKESGSDIREDKKTLIRYLLYQAVDESERKLLNSIFGMNDLKKSDVKTVITLIKKYKIQDKINKEVELLSENARKAVKKLPFDAIYRKILYELVDYNIQRIR